VLRHSVLQRVGPSAPLALSLLMVMAMAIAGCTASDPTPADHGVGRDGVSASAEKCPITCAQVACGSFACSTPCQLGSGCQTCVGRPCGSGVCHYGTGCNCAGQLCTSSGCPQGTGCLP
jgi:hypothetical protein